MLNPALDRRPLTRAAGVALATVTVCITLPLAGLHALARAPEPARASVAAALRAAAIERQAQGTDCIVGLVRDPKGLVIPGASVTAYSPGTRVTAHVITDEEGRYRFEALPSGVYQLKFALRGFKDVQFDNLSVTPERTQTIDVSLQVVNADIRMTITPTSPTGVETLPPNPIARTNSGSTLGGLFAIAGLRQLTRPPYPQEALAAQTEGTVVLRGMIGV